jgi:hypothetical protein
MRMKGTRNDPAEGWRRMGRWVGLSLGMAGVLTGCGPAPSSGEDSRVPTSVPGASRPIGGGTNRTSVSSVAALPPDGTATIAAGAADGFVDVTRKAGLRFVHQLCDERIVNILESNGAGGVVLDVDQDGWMDLFLVNSGPLEGVTHVAPGTLRQPNRLFRNLGNGTFEDATVKAGLTGSGYGVTAAAGDFDNDGFPDLYVVNVGTNLLYRNRGDGTYEDVTVKAGVGHPGTGISAVFADVDRDGLLDLFVANYLQFDPTYRLFFQPDGFPNALAYKPEFNVLYRNRGDGTFEDVSEAAGIRIEGHRAMCVTVLDADLDGSPDFYVSNDLSPNLLLLNDGRGKFRDVAAERGVAFNALGEAAGSMGATVGDANGDGLPDLLVTRFGYGSLYFGGTNGLFSDQMMASGLGAITAQFVAWGGVFVDFDNDRDEDIFIANGDAHYLVGWQSLLLENLGNSTFTDAAEHGGAVFHAKLRGRGAATLDFDNDGRLDLLMTAMADRPFLLRNQGTRAGHWLKLQLEGSRSNRDGFGSTLRVTAGGRTTLHGCRASTTFLMQGDPRVHIGLGAATRADRIEIRWPSGVVQTLENVAADQILRVAEPADRP